MQRVITRPIPVPDVDTGTPALLDVRNLKVHIQTGVNVVRAVDGVDLRVMPGECVGIVGESGSGKSTLARSISRLMPPVAFAEFSGSAAFNGVDLLTMAPERLRQLRRSSGFSMIFQDPFASLNPRMRVGEIIAEGMGALALEADSVAQATAVAALLKQVGLPDEAAGRYPHEFSGGQRQRIAIARALAVQPQLLICDEPTSALDVSVQAQILNLLKELQEALGIAYLFITHNFAVVEYLANDVAVMYLGRIVERGKREEVLRSPQHPYTQALLSAVPVPRLEAHPAAVRLPGETPSPANPPGGCHFHPRCPQAMDICRQRYPETSSVSATHTVNCHLTD